MGYFMSKIFLVLVVVVLNAFTFFYAPEMKEVMVLIDYTFFIVVMSMILVREKKKND